MIRTDYSSANKPRPHEAKVTSAVDTTSTSSKSEIQRDSDSYSSNELEGAICSEHLESTGASGRLCSIDYEKLATRKSDPATSAPTRYASASPGVLKAVAAGDTSLDWGTKGPPVQEVQRLMLAQGADFKKYAADGRVLKDYGADGYYGPVTKREIQKLQTKWGLDATGEIDQPTLARLRAGPEKLERKTPEHALMQKPIPPAKLRTDPAQAEDRIAKLSYQLEALSKEIEQTPGSGPTELRRHTLEHRRNVIADELFELVAAQESAARTTIKAHAVVRLNNPRIRL